LLITVKNLKIRANQGEQQGARGDKGWQLKRGFLFRKQCACAGMTVIDGNGG
jgi:hypothetical protein